MKNCKNTQYTEIHKHVNTRNSQNCKNTANACMYMSALEIPRKTYIYNTHTYTRRFTLVIHTRIYTYLYSNHQKLQNYYACLPNAPYTHSHAHAHTYIHIRIHTCTHTRTHTHAMYACKHTTKISKYYTNHLKFSASPKSPGMDF